MSRRTLSRRPPLPAWPGSAAQRIALPSLVLLLLLSVPTPAGARPLQATLPAQTRPAASAEQERLAQEDERRREEALQRLGEEVTIPGTGIAIRPPPGFEKTDLFTGLYDLETESSIVVVRVPGGFGDADARVKPGAVISGMQVQTVQPALVHGRQARFATGTQQAQGRTVLKRLVLIDAGDDVVMLVANLVNVTAETDADYIEAAELAVHTAQVAQERADPSKAAEELGYGLVPKPPFQLAHAIGGTLLYTPGGKLPDQRQQAGANREAMVIVVPPQRAPAQNQQLAEQTFRQFSGGKAPDTVERREVAGFPAFLLSGKGDEPHNDRVVQLVIFPAEAVMVITGITPGPKGDLGPAVREMVLSFIIRPEAARQFRGEQEPQAEPEGR